MGGSPAHGASQGPDHPLAPGRGRTWVWVSPSWAASSARSGSARYWVCWKRWLRACSCRLE